jgi:serine/threonine protein kinase
MEADIDLLRHIPKIDRSEIQLIREIGSGTCGSAWLGHYKGKDVVVKFILEWTDQCYDKRREFEAEVVVMAGLTHPNIIPLLGICTSGVGVGDWELTDGPALVMPYMRMGDLKRLLRDDREGREVRSACRS